MIDIENSTKKEIINEYNYITGEVWSKYSCDCLGFYVKALHKKIIELGGFTH